MGIPVYEKVPDSQSLLASDPASPADEEAIEEAAAALAALDAELGRTTDPVRMYMREMGTVELLTREGEIRIAKRIEEGLDAVRLALAHYPATHESCCTPTNSSRPARRAWSTWWSASSIRTRPTSSRSRRIRPRSTRPSSTATSPATKRPMTATTTKRPSTPVRIRRKSRAAWR